MVKIGQKHQGQRTLQHKADRLFSAMVRKRADNKCEYCGLQKNTLHCHHGVVHRRYLNTRYLLDNCVCVCVGCHNYLGDFPQINTEFFIKRIGTGKMEQIQNLARAINGKFDYTEVIKGLEDVRK